YLFGSVPEPFTLYRQIRAVPAGSYITVSQSGVSKPTVWFSVAEIFSHTGEQEKKIEAAQPSQLFRCHLLDSVKYHLEADVPVGAFLSAGIDSGALVGLMTDLRRDKRAITTVTLGFDEFKGSHGDEVPLAAQAAEYYGTKHVIRRISKAEFLQDVPLFFKAMDQPSIDGMNTWFVSKAAHELGLKVAVSGLGGDELFGGYPSYQDIPKWVRTFSLPSRCPYLGDAFRNFFIVLNPPGFNPKTAGLLKYGGDYPGAYLLKRGLFMPWELSRLLDPDLVREGMSRLRPLDLLQQVLPSDSVTPFRRVAALESCFYMRNQLLRDADWAGMAHSLEIRVPLVDTALLRNIAPLLDGSDEKTWKQLLGTAPQAPLPNEILSRKKTGFGLPMQAWLKDCTVINNDNPLQDKRRQDV
ncbi:MAG: asparagine synthase, partial [Candidatus Electrothrix sp. ATG2]|nr:asparagine synthase [Candidatus Electrothrix sp. ATG2]